MLPPLLPTREKGDMEDKKKWMELCEQASTEQDPKKLLELIAEIIRLLDEKEKQLVHGPTKPERD
jgi:hypothetical protein